ncbi:carboxypeptidase B isoform X1 [Hydra vulgaris]|uniref:carboxypeptidase B isoform X1 n=1 Tax=Hydra vulgaris TaxID=6087 RepID=UPI001F5EB6E0|nr:carboxypeptidase B-like [Hydra vulgaris]
MATYNVGYVIIYVSLLQLILGAEVFPRFKPYKINIKNVSGLFDYTQYQPFNMIEKELHKITKSQLKSVKVKLFSIGTTFENRSLWALKIEEKDTRKLKKNIVIDCGAHAREWLAPSTCMYIINKLTLEHPSLKNTKLIKRFNWIIIPVLNPDGYAYTWHNQSTRLWRKNRSFTAKQLKFRKEKNDELCIGVDINRNFDEEWGGVGAPANPCFEMYAGDKPFSEKESIALSNFLNTTINETLAYISLHAFGLSWMTPWGFKKQLPKSFNEMKRVAQIAVNAMKKLSGVKYSIGTSHDKLYPNSGSSIDWAHSKLHIPYTYLIEMLPGNNKTSSIDMSSFMPPPNMMVQNAKDILEGLRAMAISLLTPI